MHLALHSLSVYEQIVEHANLKIMTKITDQVLIDADNHCSAKEQSEALRRAWISNTEVKLLTRKSKLMSTSWN